MTFVSYAQNFEDVLLWRAFRHVPQGFYIDVGAAHPDQDSVTRAFYDRGWSGINIEPVPELYIRLAAARPRDVNLSVAVGEASGAGVLHVVAGTGLSTTDAALAENYRADRRDIRGEIVRLVTLAEICREHAATTIHFLKIDVEGAERAALAGADFTTYRPWIVLVEATAPASSLETHAEWEPILLDAGYRFLWFDGLNRFYAAAEQYDGLAPHFRIPVCVFDDFLRAADSEWTRRISHAEMQAADLLERSMTAEAAIAVAEARAEAADRRADAAAQRAEAAERRQLQADAQAASEAQQLMVALKRAQDDAESLRGSTSWRLTAPLRGAVKITRAFALKRRSINGAPPAVAAPPRNGANGHRPTAAHGHANHVPENTAAGAPIRAVHQFHSGSAAGDAITNAMLLIRARLRAWGYRSDIYVEHLDGALAADLHGIDELPRHNDYVLLLHHSMGFDAYERIIRLPVPKILIYHNITPSELFAGQPEIQAYAELGRKQLAGLREHVVAALADSEFNTMELRKLGFAEPQACTLLFDLQALRRQQHDLPAARDAGRPFTWLFVGRVVASKCQLELVEAFAAFRRIYKRPCELVLVGHQDGAGREYAEAVKARVRALGLQNDVILTGVVTDDVLMSHYRRADVYVSLSRHEGFGVPLVEAAVAGVPVLAWPAGAVAFTLGGQDGLLRSRAPEDVARQVADLAADPDGLLDIGLAQQAALARFDLPPHLEMLGRALAKAGVAAPRDDRQQSLLLRNLHVTVAGHVNKTYSLAAINRTLARAVEYERPGRVRLLPVEGEPTSQLNEVPAEEYDLISRLAARPPHETGPVVVISQHYPVYVPAEPADARMALVFWEESLLPAATVETLNRSFDAVLAPSQFVAKALLDSGVSLPVHWVGFAPELDAFLAVDRAGERPVGDIFTFLHVSSAFPRKGIDVLLAAYARTFRAGDPVRLVIKTFGNPHNDVAAQITALRAADPQAPMIEVIDDDFGVPEMADLFRDADAMVLPTRGEGFNLPAAEAMAACVPLIVTGYGGHMDFCNAANARLVDYRLAPSRSHLATPMSLWAEPDVADLAAALRDVHDDRAGREARARQAHTIAGRLLSREAFVQRIEAASIETIMRPPARPLRLCLVSSWNVRCGIADYTRFLVEGMRNACPDLELSILSDARNPEPREGDEFVRVRPAWTIGSPQADQSLRAAAASEDPDALLIQHQPGLIGWSTLGSAVLALAAPQRVLAVTLHNTATLPELEKPERDLALSGLQAATRVIVHTLIDLERLRDLGVADNVVLISQGAPKLLAMKPERALGANDTITIGSCGFLLPGKGMPTLVEAIGLLKPRWPHVRLRLLTADYGSKDSKAEAALVRTIAKETGLDADVELVTDFLPYDTLRAGMAACDVVVLPYPPSKEGSSAALRMAVSSGACVAVTPIDLFADAADAAWRLPGTDAVAIADGLGTLLADRDLRIATQRAARRWLSERGWNVVGTRTIGMLRGLVASHKGVPDRELMTRSLDTNDVARSNCVEPIDA